MKIWLQAARDISARRRRKLLLAAGHEVTVYDSLVTGYREAVPVGSKVYPGRPGGFSCAGTDIR